MAIKKSGKEKASLLKYKMGKDRVPVYLGTASGELARQIIALARKLDLDIVENPEMCDALGTLPPGIPIPERLYLAVAEILAFCYQLKSKKNKQK